MRMNHDWEKQQNNDDEITRYHMTNVFSKIVSGAPIKLSLRFLEEKKQIVVIHSKLQCFPLLERVGTKTPASALDAKMV